MIFIALEGQIDVYIFIVVNQQAPLYNLKEVFLFLWIEQFTFFLPASLLGMIDTRTCVVPLYQTSLGHLHNAGLQNHHKLHFLNDHLFALLHIARKLQIQNPNI